MATLNIPTSQQYYYIRKGRSGTKVGDTSLSPEGGEQFWTKVSNPNYVAPDTRTTTEKLSDEYTKAYKEAKASNESRYNKLLSNLDAQKAEATQLLEGYGTAQKSKIADTYKQSLSNSLQNLAGTGLYNTTAYGTTQTGSAKNKATSEAELDESINTQKLNAYGTINAARNAVIENRTDEYPDMSTFLNMLNQYGYTGADGSATGYGSSSTSSSSSTGGLDGKGARASVTMRLPNGKTVTNYGQSLPTGTKYTAGGGTARTSSFKNTYGSQGMTKLKTPSSSSMAINPNSATSGSGYKASTLNNLYKKYGTVKNKKTGTVKNKKTGTVSNILNKGIGSTVALGAKNIYNQATKNWAIKNALKQYGKNLISYYSPSTSYKSSTYRSR